MHALILEGTTIWTISGGILLALAIIGSLTIIGIWLAVRFIMNRLGLLDVKLPKGVVQMDTGNFVDTNHTYAFYLAAANNADEFAPISYKALKERGATNITTVYLAASTPKEIGSNNHKGRVGFVIANEFESWNEHQGAFPITWYVSKEYLSKL